MSDEAAILYVFFSRADCVEKSFSAIRQARPRRLYLATDAPRRGVPSDSENCAKAQAMVESLLDWPCTVLRDRPASNVGPDERLESALDWIFHHEEKAIVLEEDCVAGADFIPFCNELLLRYAADPRVGMISGDQFVPGGWPLGQASYTFSYLAQIWGWATWRRTWANHSRALTDWPEARRTGLLRRIFPDYYPHRRYWRRRFDRCHEGSLNVWDYRWAFTRWRQLQVSVVPTQNLVSNIGFRDDAVHTRGYHPAANLPVAPAGFPLHHPEVVAADRALDDATARILFYEGGYWPWFEYHWKKRILGRPSPP